MDCRPEDFGAAIKAERKRLGLSSEELGYVINVSGRTIQRWEDGNRNIRKRNYMKLMHKFPGMPDPEIYGVQLQETPEDTEYLCTRVTSETMERLYYVLQENKTMTKTALVRYIIDKWCEENT